MLQIDKQGSWERIQYQSFSLTISKYEKKKKSNTNNSKILIKHCQTMKLPFMSLFALMTIATATEGAEVIEGGTGRVAIADSQLRGRGGGAAEELIEDQKFVDSGDDMHVFGRSLLPVHCLTCRGKKCSKKRCQKCNICW